MARRTRQRRKPRIAPRWIGILVSALLLESGSDILLEQGGSILLE